MSVHGGWAVTERPILFSDAMVRAILEGRKTQTRRVVRRPTRVHPLNFNEAMTKAANPGWTGVQKRGPEDGIEWSLRCPYGHHGDLLWVRETWEPVFGGSMSQGGKTISGTGFVDYRAGGPSMDIDEKHPHWNDLLAKFDSPAHCASEQSPCWLPSIHMPRWASRLTLRVADVRVERLQAITNDDARAEGVNEWGGDEPGDYRGEFRDLWDSINGKRPGCSWADSPWVWVVSFTPQPPHARAYRR